MQNFWFLELAVLVSRTNFQQPSIFISLLQVRQNDSHSGGAGSLRSGIISEFCLSVLATASLSKLLEYERMKNGLLWHLLLETHAKRSKKCYSYKCIGSARAEMLWDKCCQGADSERN